MIVLNSGEVIRYAPEEYQDALAYWVADNDDLDKEERSLVTKHTGIKPEGLNTEPQLCREALLRSVKDDKGAFQRIIVIALRKFALKKE